ncbi:MAG: hypothetical protein R3Y27_06590 [Clostridia bacterium]
MQEYTSQDFIKMQEQAIQRVKQMQSRAKNSEVPPKQTDFDEDDVKIYHKISKNQEQKLQDKPQNEKSKEKLEAYDKKIHSDARADENVKLSLPKPIQKRRSSGPLGAFLSMDNDTALILPLILLLGKEGADDILLLALLYILT